MIWIRNVTCEITGIQTHKLLCVVYIWCVVVFVYNTDNDVNI